MPFVTTPTRPPRAAAVGRRRRDESASSASTASSPTTMPLLSRRMTEKADAINLLLLKPEVDLWRLREMALSEGGLVNDNLRQRAWPKLVGLDHNYDPLPLPPSLGGSSDGSSPSQGEGADLWPHPFASILSKHGNPNSDSDHTMQQRPPPPLPEDTTPRFEIDASELKAHEAPPSRLSGPPLLVESMDADQIERDVARCTWHLLTGSQRSRRHQYRNKQRNRKMAALLKRKQRKLANLINLTLVGSYGRVPTPDQRLRYYQGYHDVACIFLHALGGASAGGAGVGANQSIPIGGGVAATQQQTPTKNNDGGDRVNMMAASPALSTASHMSTDTAATSLSTAGAAGLDLPSKVLCQVSLSHFGDALQSNFLQLQTALKIVLFPLLHTLDPVVHAHLHDADMEPFFCLSWILTWFAHDVRDTDVVKRLFDAFLVSHPLLPVYTALAMMLHPYNRRCILDTDCDFAALHQCLAGLPKHSCHVGWKRRPEEGAMYVSDDEPEPAAAPHDSHAALHREAERLQQAIAISKEEQALQRQQRPRGDGDDSYDDDDDGEHEWIPLKQSDDLTASTEDLEFYSKSTNSLVSTTCEPWTSPSGSTSNSSIRNALTTTNLTAPTSSDPVPFEEVLAAALKYMKRYPPNSLVELAKRYYQDDWNNQLALLHHAGNNSTRASPSASAAAMDVQQQIGLLRPSPTWSIVPSCTSDWVIKQRLRQTLGLRATSRNDRRRRKRTSHVTTTANETSPLLLPSRAKAPIPHVEPMSYVLSNPCNLAVIAVGYGPGLGHELFTAAAIGRRRRKLLVGAVVFGVLAVGATTLAYQGLGTSKGTVPSFASSFSASLPSFGSTVDPVNDLSLKDKEAAAMKKAASVILPRLNVLRQTKDGLCIPPHNPKVPNAKSTPSPPKLSGATTTKTSTPIAASTGTTSSVATILSATHTPVGITGESASSADRKSSSVARKEDVSAVPSALSVPSVGGPISPVDHWKRTAVALVVQAKRVATHLFKELLQSLRHFHMFWKSRRAAWTIR